MKPPGSIRRRRVLVSILLILVIVLSGTGMMERLLGPLGLNALSATNGEYLDSAFRRSLGMFGVLSTIKVGLAIVEGTEIGVGFGLQVGDIVQAAYDYVDIAWRTVLAGTVILLGTTYLLQTAALLDHWFFFATAIAIFGMFLAAWLAPARLWLRRGLRDLSLFMSVLTVALYLMIPLSVAGGSFLSKQITAPVIREAEAGLSAVRTDLFPDIRTPDEGVLSQFAHVKNKLERIASYLKDRARDLVVWIFKIIAGYLFDCIVFPLSLLVSLLWFTRMTARYLFGIRQRQSFREDLEELFIRHGFPAARAGTAPVGDALDEKLKSEEGGKA